MIDDIYRSYFENYRCLPTGNEEMKYALYLQVEQGFAGFNWQLNLLV